MIAQLIYIMLSLVGLMIHTVNHGEAKDDKYNVYSKMSSLFIFNIILYYGGFWDCLK